MLALLGLVACSAPPARPAALPTAQHVVDLSHTIAQDMPHTADEAPAALLDRDAAGQTRLLQVPIARATHLYVPPDLTPGTGGIEYYSPRELVVPAVVLDVRADAADNPYYRLPVRAIRGWEAQHGRIPAGVLVLVATGWDIHWGDGAAYLNVDARGHPRTPGISAEAAQLLVIRQVAGVGIDAPREHVAYERGLVLANMTRLEQLPARGSLITIGALGVQGNSSSPARVLALLP